MSVSTPYYTLAEAAQLLKLHPQTLRRWIREGRLTAKRFGKQFRLHLEDLEQVANPPAVMKLHEAKHFDQFALAVLSGLWDNPEDAIYDDWKKLYGVE